MNSETPLRLAGLTVTLSGRVKNLSQGQTVELSASESFSLNSIDKTAKVEDLHLAKFGPDYVIEVLGRTGEPRANRPVRSGAEAPGLQAASRCGRSRANWPAESCWDP